MVHAKELADIIRELLLKYDPLFAVADPKNQYDEYDSELAEVVHASLEYDSHKELRKELCRIFRSHSGIFEAGTRFRYTELAKEILKKKEEIANPKGTTEAKMEAEK